MTKNPYILLGEIIFVLLLFIALIIALSKVFKKKPKNNELEEAEETNEANLSYSPATYERFANQLFEAFRGVGTDEDQVIRIINELKTYDDWLALVKAFGIRKVPHLFGDIEGTLSQLLAYELEDSEDARTKVYNHLHAIGVEI